MEIATRIFEDDGSIPNNGRLPVILYKAAFSGDQAQRPESYEELFHGNNWKSSWRNGIFLYHHYHSTAHEVLGIYRGRAEVLLGGEAGETVVLGTGDIALLPAGTGHKNISQSGDFEVVGAYPDAQSPDMNYGDLRERPEVLNRISRVPLPSQDPVFGADPVSAVREHWK